MAGIFVVGAGQAGVSLVAKLRGLGYEGDLTLIGAEAYPPYQRPPLSKAYLLGEMPEERLYLRPRSFFAEHNIALKLSCPVMALNTGEKTLHVDGEDVAYDQLALTTGSIPNRLPAAMGGELDHVFTVRGLGDIERMAPLFQRGCRVLVVGGGYIGLEAAAVAAKLGLHVTVIEREKRILGRVAAPETADVIRELHKSHHVEIRENCGLTSLEEREGHVASARLTDGTTIPVDFVIVGTGIRPDTRLAEEAGLMCDNGIAVDEMGRTSAEDVWAAGDCTSFPHEGGRLRLESVGNAIDQAEAVAANMLGAEEPYVAKPWFWSDQYDMKLQIAGLNTGYDRVVVRDVDGARSHWYFAGDRLLAVDAMNAPRDYMVGKRLIESGKSPDANALSDPDTDLKSLLKA